MYVLRRGVGMQLVEAALAEQLDPAHESCAAVSSGLIGAREEQAWHQEEELPSSHSRCLITTFVCSADRVKRSYECLAHTCDEEPRHSLKGGNGDAKLGTEVQAIQPAANFSGERDGGAGGVCRRGCCSYVSSVAG